MARLGLWPDWGEGRPPLPLPDPYPPSAPASARPLPPSTALPDPYHQPHPYPTPTASLRPRPRHTCQWQVRVEDDEVESQALEQQELGVEQMVGLAGRGGERGKEWRGSRWGWGCGTPWLALERARPKSCPPARLVRILKLEVGELVDQHLGLQRTLLYL